MLVDHPALYLRDFRHISWRNPSETDEAALVAAFVNGMVRSRRYLQAK